MEGIFVFIKFPVRRGTKACYHHRKPFRQEISRLRFAALEMTGASWGRCVPQP